ncbi:hypothetical protein [Aquimarina litoralis]|uniref:hypothetical protein n=1 Tax=Aquimarina litoralis TaxID=584605 RepID=UPI001C598874|nr:hypothetical protein [Aquimarina litoralis]MBW1295152.1 hypothetical protein [Aquimarina litoralis]
MLKKAIVIIVKIIFVIILTVLTQIGGILYLIIEIIFSKKYKKYRIRKYSTFLLVYLISTFIIIPYIAPIFGREKIKNTSYIEACTFFTLLSNRNYVTPDLNNSLQNIAKKIHQKHNGVKLVYLDANFPFKDGFPLLPHLSHNDGKKVDLSFIYLNKEGQLTNKKPSIFGYGVFEDPKANEFNQNNLCKKKGYWQYDVTKYVTFGIVNNQLKLSEKATKDLILAVVNDKMVGKVFIEPHLKSRLHLKNSKIRFHGCQAVRHDDHIHLQLK